MKSDIIKLIQLTEISNISEDPYYSLLVFEQQLDLTSSSQQPPKTFLQKHGGKLALGGAGIIGGLLGHNYLQNNPEVANKVANKWNELTKDAKDLGNTISSKLKSTVNSGVEALKDKKIDYNLTHDDPRNKTTEEIMASMKGLSQRGTDLQHIPGGDHHPYSNAYSSNQAELTRRFNSGDKTIPRELLSSDPWKNIGTNEELRQKAFQHGGIRQWGNVTSGQVSSGFRNIKNKILGVFG